MKDLLMKLNSIQYKNHKIFYHYHPKKDEQHMSVFLNGLSDSIQSWKQVVDLFNEDHSYLLIDLLGQGETLEDTLRKSEQTNIAFDNYSIEKQIEIVSLVLEHLKIISKINLVGFSYGGGIAVKWASENPEKINKLILLVPFIIRLDLANPLSRVWWKNYHYLEALPGLLGRQFQMWERIYNQFIHEYMQLRYENRIPSVPHRNAAIHLSEEIMKFNCLEVLHKLPSHSTYLLTVEKDTLVPKELYEELWEKIPEHIKESWHVITDGEHLILEQAPQLVAAWVETIIKSQLKKGILASHVGT